MKALKGTISVDLFCLTGSWKGKSLTSRRSKAKFERTIGHIGNEKPRVIIITSSRESWSMLARVNQLTEIIDIYLYELIIYY